MITALQDHRSSGFVCFCCLNLSVYKMATIYEVSWKINLQFAKCIIILKTFKQNIFGNVKYMINKCAFVFECIHKR